jgi:4-amino-4-deoxy-L-arabinose transferase-like glycosyltransferase
MNDNGYLNRRDFVFLVTVFLAALIVRLYFLPFYRVISADGVGYVTAARSLLRGEFSALTTYGVVYPALTAFVNIMGFGTETAGRLVSVVMGSLLVVPLYLLARDFFDRNVGAIACILVIAWPPLRSWAGEVMTQSTYITLLVTWYWLLWQAFRRGTFRWSLAAGAVAGLSYLTRPESLIAFILMLPVLLLSPASERSVKEKIILAATCAGAFVFMLLPFVMLVHHVTGQWQLSGKGGAALADALSEYLGRPDLKNEPGFQGIGLLEVIRSYPEFLIINLGKNQAKTLQTMVPWYLWAAAAIGFAVGGWKRELIQQRLYLLASFAPLGIIIIFFFVGPEYLQPYLPVLFLWVGNGMCEAEQRLLRPLAAWEGFTRYGVRAPLSIVTAILLTIFSFIGQVPADRNKPYHCEDDGGRYDQRRIGELLKKHLPPGSRIMTRWGRISFYAEMENVGMPQTDLMEMVATAKRSGVRYIIIDGMLIGARPQFRPLFAPLLNGARGILYVKAQDDPAITPIAGVRLHLLYKDPSSVGVVVYEVVN